MEHFKKLNAINVNEHTEEKDGLTYLSWAWAWAEVKKAYPDATYAIKRFDGKPYLFDEELGYMVFTEMTIENHTHEMWLPVMNGAKKAMKNEPYTYEVKKYVWDNQKRKNVWTGEYEDKTVEPATMFDINTAIMRCLTKNIAMFGLGLYIYAGEDLPEGAEVIPPAQAQQTQQDDKKPAPKQQTAAVKKESVSVDVVLTFGKHKGKTVKEIHAEAPDYVEWLAENATTAEIKQAAKLMLDSVPAFDLTPSEADDGDLPF